MRFCFMKMRKGLVWFAGALSLFLITSSMNHHHSSVMPAILIEASAFDTMKKGLKISAKTYDATLSQNYLNHDLVRKGYTPVELKVQNNSAESYALSAASVALPNATASEVTWSVTKSAIPRGIAFKIASLFFWPLMIPSTIDSIITYKAHTTLKKDLEAKALKEQDEIVTPYTTVTRVLFVHTDGYYKDFSVSLEDVDSKELVVVPIISD